MSKITQVFEDMASGRPIKKPVKSNLLKARKDANEKALKSGFMKMPDYVKKTFEEKEEEYKPHYMYKGDKKVYAKKKEDHEKLMKQGYDHDDPKTEKIEEEKGRGPTGISYTVTPGHPDAENPKTGKKYPERQTSEYKSKWKEKSKPGLGQNVGTKNPMNEAKKNCGCGQDPCITYGKGGKKDMKESFKHYNVTHIPSGKKYKVTAMHDNSAKDKARAQHGGSASRYSGTSTNDFKVEETQFTPESVMEAKKKGLDGKACWDGYKQMGTKMKGGKRVDNCVKIKEELLGEVSDAVKLRYISKANRDIDNKERASQLADKQGAPESVGKSLSKSTGKRREGVRIARSKLGDVPKKGMSESSSWVQQTADTWNDHADNKHPKVQKHIKAAEKAYNNKDMDAFHHHTNRAADHAHSLKKNENFFDTNSWPTHNRHRQRTAARVTADTLNSDKIRKKRNEMHPAARKAYDNKVRDNNNKKYGYHPQIGHKQNKTTPLPKHMHHPKVGLNDSIQMDVYKSLMELSPKTISSYQKKAGAQYRQLRKDTPSRSTADGGYYKGYISDKEYDSINTARDKMKKRGKGLSMSAGKGVKKEEVQQVDELKKSTLASYVKRATGDAISRSHTSQYNIQKGMSARDKGQEKIAKKHFKTSEKESKKTMDRFHGINRAANKLSPGKDKDDYLADKNKTKMGKSEKTFKQMHSGKVKATEEQQFEESLNKLIGTTVGKIRDAAQQYKKKQDASMKAGKGIYQNPMSGDNIAKRLGPVKKKVSIKNKSTY